MTADALGFVYAATNPAMSGLVKVGFTRNLAEDRAADLYTTSVPIPFEVQFRQLTSFPRSVEARAHKLLAADRVNPDREFFRTSVDRAIAALRQALLDAAGIETFARAAPMTVINASDRIVLSAEPSHFFILLALPTPYARQAEPFDFWQVHAPGDRLEFFGTDDARRIAGLSDNDPGGTIDPVPHLSHSRSRQQITNDAIFGRERLCPGDRVLWVRIDSTRQSATTAIFEMSSYCQVVARTRDPQVTPEGWPLALETPTADSPPPLLLSVVQRAMNLPPPRTWAPRTGGAPYGELAETTPPDTWIRPLATDHRSHRDHKRRTRS